MSDGQGLQGGLQVPRERKWQMEVESVTDGVDIEMDWLALFKLSLSPR